MQKINQPIIPQKIQNQVQRAQSTYEQVPIYDLQIVNQEGKDIVKGKVSNNNKFNNRRMENGK